MLQREEMMRRMRLGIRCRRRPEVAAKSMPLTAQGVYQTAVMKGVTSRTSSMLIKKMRTLVGCSLKEGVALT